MKAFLFGGATRGKVPPERKLRMAAGNLTGKESDGLCYLLIRSQRGETKVGAAI
jgi:hypothetical protein